MGKMFKIAPDKATLFALLAVVIIGAIFFAMFVRYHIMAPQGGVAPFQEASLYKGKMPVEPARGVMEERIPQKTIPGKPDKESLPLRLVGIYEHQRKKTACIEDMAAYKTGYYRVGDSVKGARLIQILSSQVVLLKGGRKIILSMENPYAWTRPGEWVDHIAQDVFVVSRKRLNRKFHDINQLLNEMVAIPYVSNYGIEGFSIASLKKDGIIQEAGFEEGDIVKSVNGQKITDLKEPLRIYESLRSLVDTEEDPTIKIELQRDSNLRVFTYRILK